MTSAARQFLITGASSGLGEAFALAALARGHRVAATARSTDALGRLQALAPDRVCALALDLAQPGAGLQCANEAIAAVGGVDVVVLNAAYGLAGAIEELDRDELLRQFQVNVFGSVELLGGVLPSMRERGAGTVVVISSEAALVADPGLGAYCASKAAIDAIGEALRLEVASHGIDVMVVQPGAFRTAWRGPSLRVAARALPAYAGSAGVMRTRLREGHGHQPGDPAAAARALMDALEATPPPERLVLGADALEHLHARLDELGRALDASAPVAVSTAFPPKATRSPDRMEAAR